MLTALVLLLPTTIFVLGLAGLLLWKKNLISLLISLEVLFLSVNLGFILVSLIHDDMAGIIFSLAILTMAGIEISVGLALTILVYRRYDDIYLRSLNKLKA